MIEFRGPPEKQKKPAAKPRKAPAVPAVAPVPRHEAQVKRRPGRPRTSLVKRAAPPRRPRAKRAQLGRRCKGLTAPALGVDRETPARWALSQAFTPRAAKVRLPLARARRRVIRLREAGFRLPLPNRLAPLSLHLSVLVTTPGNRGHKQLACDSWSALGVRAEGCQHERGVLD